MSQTTTTLAFIGAGHMASSIIRGLVKTGWPAGQIIAAEPGNRKLEQHAQQLGIRTTNANAEAVADADIVVLAVKPQIMQSVVEPLSPVFQQHKPLIISVAAGVPEASLNRWVGGKLAIVRCMPNTPAQVQLGVSGLFANPLVTETQKTLTEQVMNGVGISLWVDTESGIDDVTALAGSAPAYFFLIMEAMIAAGEQLGVSKQAATRMVTQTALGAATMATMDGADIGQLRTQVTSPGGTTEQAIRSFEQNRLGDIVAQAINACRNRAVEMSKRFQA